MIVDEDNYHILFFASLKTFKSDYQYRNNHQFTSFLFILEENCRTNKMSGDAKKLTATI